MTSLVYHAGALGDFVTALPAIAVWRRQRAVGGLLVLLGRPAHAALAAGVVDDAWDAGGARFASLFAGQPSPEVRALLADVGSAFVFAPEAAGIVRGLQRCGVRDVVRQDPFPKERVHVVDHHLSLFPDVALAPEERLPRVAVPDGAGPSPSARPIVIHPGSGSPTKNWPIARFIELARLLESRGSIVWVVGPAEEESGTAAAIDGAIPEARVWRNLPLSELAGRLAGARLFVSDDSGVAHLAAAVGCPVVVLFGASDPAVWAPRGRSVTVVGDGTRGMEAIGVEAVIAACRTIVTVELGGDERTVSRYDSHARELSRRYESADMSQLYTMLLRYLPPKGASVLELGCGSGRDAAFLLASGYEVTAVDASAGMVAEATRFHPELAGRVSCAAIPFPADSPLLQRSFDAVVSIAVFMHIPDNDLAAAASQLRVLVRQGGILFLEVSSGRQGLQAERDGKGRLFRERRPEEYRLLFERHGFVFVGKDGSSDSRCHPSLRWVSLVFRAAAA
ncbi:MAG: methyltransferase domain-containing protein [Spirochaetes bacterium]|nr:methyltransferase domain-containing protein [Spirochaetota bacterium]